MSLYVFRLKYLKFITSNIVIVLFNRNLCCNFCLSRALDVLGLFTLALSIFLTSHHGLKLFDTFLAILILLFHLAHLGDCVLQAILRIDLCFCQRLLGQGTRACALDPLLNCRVLEKVAVRCRCWLLDHLLGDWTQERIDVLIWVQLVLCSALSLRLLSLPSAFLLLSFSTLSNC